MRAPTITSRPRASLPHGSADRNNAYVTTDFHNDAVAPSRERGSKPIVGHALGLGHGRSLTGARIETWA